MPKKTTKKTITSSQSLIAGGMFKGAKFSGGAFTKNSLTQVIKHKEEKKCRACQELVGADYPNNCQCEKEEDYCGHCQSDQVGEPCTCKKEEAETENDSDSADQAEQSTNHIQALITEGDFAQAEFSEQAFTNNDLKQTFGEEEQKVEVNEEIVVSAEDLSPNTYQLSLKFLKAKDYFYLSRKNTINNLQNQIQVLEDKLAKLDNINALSDIVVTIGSFTSSLDKGITEKVGKSLKTGTNLFSYCYITKQGKQIHLALQTSEEENNSLGRLDWAYSQLNDALRSQKEHDLFGLLDSRYHRAFKVDYQLYVVLNKQVSIWPDRNLNRERLEQIYASLQANLTELDQEINNEFLKLKSEDQAKIRKENEIKLANQVRIISQEQRIKELEEQIISKEKELIELVNAIKTKLASGWSKDRTEKRHALFTQFLDNGIIDPKLTSVTQQKKVNLQTITDLKNSIQNLEVQLTELKAQELEAKVEQLSISK